MKFVKIESLIKVPLLYEMEEIAYIGYIIETPRNEGFLSRWIIAGISEGGVVDKRVFEPYSIDIYNLHRREWVRIEREESPSKVPAGTSLRSQLTLMFD